jgi:molybdopterin biosynthesis enzyme
MGAADLVKPLLEELGTVHFGRLNMKPGKPTTFATYENQDRKVLFFGLPGNLYEAMLLCCMADYVFTRT